MGEFLNQYGLDGSKCFVATELEPGQVSLKGARLQAPFTVSSLFADMLDVFGRPSKNFLKQLSKTQESGSKERGELEHLISEEGAQAYSTEVTGESLTFADVLLKYTGSNNRPSLDQLITMLPQIKPRLYTIASSTRHTPDSIELTVITNTWETGSGVEKTGSCTDFFERIAGKDGLRVNCGITPGSFQFPKPDVPMVMTGTGTGVAPFLAFARERQWLVDKDGKSAANSGEMWLFFGCRFKAKDYILGDELEAMEKQGVLTHLRPAFSRDGPKKVYIQDRIKEEAEGVYNALVTQQGYLYLCGQAGDRETDVLNSVRDAFVAGGGLSEECQQELDKLIDEGRYCPELY